MFRRVAVLLGLLCDASAWAPRIKPPLRRARSVARAAESTNDEADAIPYRRPSIMDYPSLDDSDELLLEADGLPYRRPSVMDYPEVVFPDTLMEPPSAVSELRRSLYKTLLPLDRGDFRLEMLVPWTNKTLTKTDKIIVVSTFITLALTGQQVLTPGASSGVHLSYVAQFFSYAIGNPIGFRLISIVGSLFEIVADSIDAELSEDAIPIVYNFLFLPINGYYVLRWLLNREALAFTAEETALYLNCFASLGFSQGQFSRLLNTATFESVPIDGEPTTLCVQGEELTELFVPINGTVDVFVSGVIATSIPPYQLIGEANLLEFLQIKEDEEPVHLPARSTIVAEPGSKFVRWQQASLRELQVSQCCARTAQYSFMIEVIFTTSSILHAIPLVEVILPKSTSSSCY